MLADDNRETAASVLPLTYQRQCGGGSSLFDSSSGWQAAGGTDSLPAFGSQSCLSLADVDRELTATALPLTLSEVAWQQQWPPCQLQHAAKAGQD